MNQSLTTRGTVNSWKGLSNVNKYTKIVQWSVEDDCFIGSCPGLFFGGVCHGDNEAEVFKDLAEVVEDEVDRGGTMPKPEPYFFNENIALKQLREGSIRT